MQKNIYSQNEEQSIIQKIITQFAITPTAVEVGINTGAKGDGTTLQGSTVFLKDKEWDCLWIDGKTQYTGVLKKMIYPENIVEVLQDNFLQKQIGIFSIDIDSEDWHVVRALLEHGYWPDVFVCETNSYLDPLQDLVMPLGHRRTVRPKSICHGATLRAFENLLSKFKYNFYCNTRLGMNSFWIHDSISKKVNDIALFKDNRHPCTTNWSRTAPTDIWNNSKELLDGQ